jgi:aryl-alcohol dehydrogenase-like predicted oxidoreductase
VTQQQTSTDAAPRGAARRYGRRGTLAGAAAAAGALMMGLPALARAQTAGGGPATRLRDGLLQPGAQGATGPAASTASSTTRRLGSLQVSALGMGVQNTSRKYDTTVPHRPDMVRLIRAAFDQGVTFFDAAEAYGPFEVERILGEAIAPFRNQVVITSKFGWNLPPEGAAPAARQSGQPLNSKPDHVRAAVDGMLRRLRTDRIDLLYQHRVDPEVPIEDVAGAVEDLMDQGKVLHWGLSEMGLDTLRRAHAALPVTAVQNEYSMLWRGPEAEVIPMCEELGIGFVPWSPLGAQFLTGAIDANTRFAPGDVRGIQARFAPETRPNNLALVDLVKQWAERKEAAPAQIALAWLLAQKPWIVPIPGTTDMGHMLQNSGAAAVRFTPAELAELNASLSAIEIRGARLEAFTGIEAPPKGGAA